MTDDELRAGAAYALEIADVLLGTVSRDEFCPPVDMTADFFVRTTVARLGDGDRTRVERLLWATGRLASRRAVTMLVSLILACLMAVRCGR